MKRTELKRKTALRQGRPTLKAKKPMARGAVQLARRVRMKTRGPKMTPIRKSARGQDCTIRIPYACNFDPATTVLCHSNLLADGKGMGLKAPDTRAAFGCSACHDILDGRRAPPPGMTAEQILDLFEIGVARTHAILRARKLMPEEVQQPGGSHV